MPHYRIDELTDDIWLIVVLNSAEMNKVCCFTCSSCEDVGMYYKIVFTNRVVRGWARKTENGDCRSVGVGVGEGCV